MSYPKMIYSAAALFKSQKALEGGLISGELKTRVVASKDEEIAAVGDGWTEDLAALIEKPKKAKP